MPFPSSNRSDGRHRATALHLGVAAACLALAACGGGSDGADGNPGATGRAGLTALASTSIEAVGANCATGGSRISAGLDANVNGTLDASEVSSTQFVCNGAIGAVGPTGAMGQTGAMGAAGGSGVDGAATLVAMTPEAAGAYCTLGGTRVSAGVDTNGDGVLGMAEVASVSYVCNGATGAPGATGATGAAGATGTNGTNGAGGATGPVGAAGAAGAAGANGATGRNSLLAIVAEASGSNCPYAGKKVTSGIDLDGNGVLDTSEVTTTNFVCNGVPGPGITWIDVTANAVAAQSFMGYLADSASRVVVTLPVSPTIGDIVSVTGAGDGGWTVAQNAGQYIAVGTLSNVGPGVVWNRLGGTQGGPAWYGIAVARGFPSTLVVASGNGDRTGVWRSGNGQTFSQTSLPTTLRTFHVAISASGNTLLTADNDVGGRIYVSTDGGASWGARGPALGNWYGVAMSSDGVKMYAENHCAGLYASIDGGATFQALLNSPHVCFESLAASSDGNRVVATAASNGFIYMSTDAGANWTTRDSARDWTQVGSSDNGAVLIAGTNGGQVYVSVDGGLNWSPRLQAANWQGAAVSRDGTKMVVANRGGTTYNSIDGGTTWTAGATTADWQKLVVLEYGYAQGSFLATATTSLYRSIGYTTSLGTSGSLSGRTYDAVSLQYLGNGAWVPVGTTTLSGYFTVQ